METHFYALILKSHETNSRYWICYQLSNDLDQIRNLNCYHSETLALPKEDYDAILIENLVTINSCRTGNESEFAIYGFTTPINNLKQFNIAIQ